MTTKTNLRKQLYRRLMQLHESSYLTLLSIVQGVALGFLALNCPSNPALNVECILFSATFLVIVLTWNEYLMGVASLVWIPTFFDALIPFSLSMSEIFLAKNIAGDLEKWFLSMSVLLYIACIAFGNMYVQAERYRINKNMLVKLGKLKLISMSFCLFFGVTFFTVWLIKQLWFKTFIPLFSLLSILVAIAFVFRTWFYWKRVVMYSKGL